jgi:hypothetical protein
MKKNKKKEWETVSEYGSRELQAAVHGQSRDPNAGLQHETNSIA